MKRLFLASLMLVTAGTASARDWTADQNQLFITNCVSRSMSRPEIRAEWPAPLIAQVCDCIRQTFVPFISFEQFNNVFRDNATRERGQQGMYMIASACVTAVRAQNGMLLPQPRQQKPQTWGDLVE